MTDSLNIAIARRCEPMLGEVEVALQKGDVQRVADVLAGPIDELSDDLARYAFQFDGDGAANAADLVAALCRRIAACVEGMILMPPKARPVLTEASVAAATAAIGRWNASRLERMVQAVQASAGRTGEMRRRMLGADPVARLSPAARRTLVEAICASMDAHARVLLDPAGEVDLGAGLLHALLSSGFASLLQPADAQALGIDGRTDRTPAQMGAVVMRLMLSAAAAALDSDPREEAWSRPAARMAATALRCDPHLEAAFRARMISIGQAGRRSE